MQLIPVNDPRTAQQFLQVAVELYKNDPKWIRPLDKDINEVFDTKKIRHLDLGKLNAGY